MVAEHRRRPQRWTPRCELGDIVRADHGGSDPAAPRAPCRLDGRHGHHQPADQGPAAERPRLPAAGGALRPAPDRRHGVGISVGGQTATQVAFLLDGQDNNNQQIRRPSATRRKSIKPSIDAIQEFKVVTNGYCRRVRPVVVGRDQRVAQVRHQPAARRGLRVLPPRRARREELLRHREAAVPAQSVRAALSAVP